VPIRERNRRRDRRFHNCRLKIEAIAGPYPTTHCAMTAASRTTNHPVSRSLLSVDFDTHCYGVENSLRLRRTKVGNVKL